jgi:hypothetical protein
MIQKWKYIVSWTRNSLKLNKMAIERTTCKATYKINCLMYDI